MDILLIGYGGAAFLLFALISKRSSDGLFSAPMFFAGAGVLAAAVGFGDASGGDIAEAVKQLLEMTLAVVLFTDAMTTDVKSWKADGDLPTRLLVIAMPLVILAGAVAAVLLVPDIDFLEALIVATILAPTDAALGMPVISNERVPLRVREALNIESGLNDGVALPFLLFFLTLAEVREDEGETFYSLLATSIGLALIVGLAAGWVGARLIRLASEQGWMQPRWRQIAVVALAVLTYVVADEIGGSGFIAVFVGGLVFGRSLLQSHQDIGEFSEDVSEVLIMVSFLVFGSVALQPSIGEGTWKMLVYALLSLTVVRMLPVALSMIGTHFRWPTLLYVGWFGPRGLASLVFAAILLEESGLPGTDPIFTTISLTVGLSIVLHGVTANPGAKVYADWYQRQHEVHEEMIESRSVEQVKRQRASRR